MGYNESENLLNLGSSKQPHMGAANVGNVRHPDGEGKPSLKDLDIELLRQTNLLDSNISRLKGLLGTIDGMQDPNNAAAGNIEKKNIDNFLQGAADSIAKLRHLNETLDHLLNRLNNVIG
jgi:hypothetical protein